MAGLGKRPAQMASPEFAGQFDKLSKAALIDVLWCACQLGTNETPEEILTQAARNAEIACEHRGDKLPHMLRDAAKQLIDSDGGMV